jgi:sugar lactone lactonase YvrE
MTRETFGNRPARRSALAALLVAAVMLASAGTAGAYTTTPGYVASDYVTGFPAKTWGPIGIAFDQSDNLYVGDPIDGYIYRFQPGGGQSSAATRLNESPIPGDIVGLAITRGGRIYVARYNAGDVVEIDAGTGQVLREVVSGIPGATGLAVDPISGDLFVSQNSAGSTIWRISNFANGPGTATAYVPGVPGVDGLAFDSDGTLYAEDDGKILRIAGTSSLAPGVLSDIAYVSEADGLAFGVHPPSSGLPFLIANRNDGTVTQVDFGGGVPSTTDIFTGGSRGDFAAVDSHGCLYLTQTTSIVRITGANGTCGTLSPSTPGTVPNPALAITHSVPARRPGSARACVRVSQLTLRVSQRGGVRVRSAAIYLNGRLSKRVRGSAVTAPITVSHVPAGSFMVKVVATTTNGKTLTTREFYTNCQPPPQCARLSVVIPAPRHQRITRVYAYVNGRNALTAHGRKITRIVLKKLPRGSYTVKLVTLSSRGGRKTTTNTYVGCRLSP